MKCLDACFSLKATLIMFALLLTAISAQAATRTWDGSTSNNWNTAANWAENAVPTNADDVIIDIDAAILVNVSPTINSLTISNNAAVSFTSSLGRRTITIDNTGSSIQEGSTLTLQGSTGTGTRSMTIAYSTAGSTMSIAGTLVLTAVGEGTIYNATNSATTVTGTIKNDGTGGGTVGSITSTSTTLLFSSGGTYQHEVNGSRMPTATWDAASTCYVTGVTTTVPAITSFAQSFGNFTWNCTNQSAHILLSANLTTVNGNFTVASTGATGTNQLQLSSGTTMTLNVAKNFVLTAGTLNLSAGNAVTTVNVKGDFSITGGTLTESAAGSGAIVFNGTAKQTYTSGGTVSNTINFTVNNGAYLQMYDANTTVTGAGTFTVADGGTLGVTSDYGISTGTATGATVGNIQTTTARTYTAGAKYIYNGSATQVTGSGLTANIPADLTIDNTSGVTLSAATTVSGILTLTNGILTTTATNLLSVTNTATTAVVGGSSTSYVDGPMKWTLPASLASGSTYTFPVGKSAYLPFSLVNPTTGIGAVTATVEAFSADAGGTIDATLDSKSTTEYWQLTPTGNFTNSSVSLTRQTAIAPFDVIAGCATKTGTYTNLAGTFSLNGVSASNSIGTNRFFAFAKAKPTITTSTASLSGFSYPQGYGPSTQVISFTTGGTYLTENLSVLPADSFDISLTSGASFSPQSSIALPVVNGVVSTTTIYVRMKAGYTVGAKTSVTPITCSSAGATSKTVSCSGTVTTAPVITTSASLSGFSYSFMAGPSAIQSFVASGTNLLSNITVTPPTNYEICLTAGGTYQSTPLTVATGTTIYVRLKLALGVGNYNENVVLSSTSCTSVNVPCSGTVNPAPTILNTISSLSAFIYTLGAGPSAEQTFTVSGSNLTANIVLTPPANFQISKTSGSGFVTTPTTLTLTPTGGTVSTTTIYVRMIAGLAVGSYGPNNIVMTSTGASTKSVSCQGSVVNTAAILTSKSTLTGFGYKYSAGPATGVSNGGPSTSQPFTLAGTGLGANNVTVTPPTNFAISLTESGTYQTTPLTITPASGKVNTIVYVRLVSLLPSGDYTGNISIACPSLATQNIACVGKVFATPLITAAGGGNFCPGSTIPLTSTGADIQNRYWMGPNNYYSTEQNPTVTTNATTAMSGTYSVTGNVIIGGDLVTNGNFEAGNTSFGSSYTYTVPGDTKGLRYWNLDPEGYYTVDFLPSTSHPNFQPCGDHTTGTGKQMIINGSSTPGVVVWGQSVPVLPGAEYEFDYYVQTVCAGNESQLQLYVNGVSAGPTYTANVATCSWKKFIYNASAGTNTVLNLELINKNTTAGGNDFALDDISFRQILSATESVNVTVADALPVSVAIAASATSVPQGTTVTYTATPTNGGTTPSYQWKVNGVNVGANSANYSYVPVQGDVISCVMTSSLGCTTGNPAPSNSVTMTVTIPANFWVGGISSNWGTAANWSAGFVPIAGDNVIFASTTNAYNSDAVRELVLDQDRTIGSLINATNMRLVIPAGKSLTVNNTITVTSNSPDQIYIYSSTSGPNGSLTFKNGSTSPVYATVEMYSVGRKSPTADPLGYFYKWQYFGIPLNTVKTSPTCDNSFVRRWDETGTAINNHWISVNNTYVLQPFYGYEITQNVPVGKTLYFQGQLVNWDWTSPQLAKTTTALFPGMHIFANPYTAAIDIKKLVFGSDMDKSVYLYTTGSFGSWFNNTTFGNSEGQYIVSTPTIAGNLGVESQIPSMQAMFVSVNTASANAYLTIPYNSVVKNTARQRIIGTDSVSDYEKTGIRIDVQGVTDGDRVWIFADTACTRSFDNGWDGKKMFGNTFAPKLYAVEAEGDYQIDCVNDINNTVLSFINGKDQEYTMTFTSAYINRMYQSVYLLDVIENRTVEITDSGTTYTFRSDSTTDGQKRFRIIARNHTTDSAENEYKLKVYSSGDIICVENLTNQNGELYLFDQMGHLLKKETFVANATSFFREHLPFGAYVLKAVTPNEIVGKQILLSDKIINGEK